MTDILLVSHRRRVTAITLTLIASAAAGCASSRSSFQMSSDSPVPFFGMDFELPPKFLRGSDEPLSQAGQTFAEAHSARPTD